ncbi:hypothetical protein [Actinomadura montaniterrae]|uniref:Uncharacterized protein n=1 Tax=Actinomadura montaniterrae TaxID=1803903 RepID=A0A6L3W5X7_9ACTN|nr:hypothetical protein [Actinomadura montaniterrae]KAB2384765.1 hypothetical protein F9B16_09975 [Actinomadura montaniterrae]
MPARCERGHRKTWNSGKGWYCWRCEEDARRAACDHVFDEPRFAGILGYRIYCACGEMCVGSLGEDGRPPQAAPAST